MKIGKEFIAIGIVVILSVVSLVRCNDALGEQWPHSLSIYATIPNTSMTIASIEIANVISRYVKVPTTGVSTSGTTESANALLVGKTKMAGITNFEVVNAMEGHKGFQPGGPATLRLIATVYSGMCMILTRADSGIKKFQDLKGKRFMCRARGISIIQETFLKALLWAYGMNLGDIKATPRLGWTDQAAALREGSAQAIMRPMRNPVAIVSELGRKVPLYWVPVDKNREIHEKFPECAVLTLRKGTYDFIKKDVPCIGFQAVIAVRSDLPESLVYEITKAIYTHLDEIKKSNPVFSQFNMKFGVSNWNAPYHSGVVKYYKEVGKWTPDMEQAQQKILSELGQTK